MQIEYTAFIEATDDATKTMLVRYTSPGRRDILCGVALPSTPEELNETVNRATPFGVWLEDERPIYVPEIGTVVSGSIALAPPSPPAPETPSLPFHAPAQNAVPVPPQVPPPAAGAAGGFPTRYVPGNSPFGEPGLAMRASEPEVRL